MRTATSAAQAVLSPEQNLRRALIDNVPRDRMIEIIAQHLFRSGRAGFKTNHRRPDKAPREWYRSSVFRTQPRAGVRPKASPAASIDTLAG